MRYQHDHLRHSVCPAARLQELVRQLRRRDQHEAELVAVEAESRIHVLDPQHYLGQACARPSHAAIAETIAARLMSLARGGTEQPGASSRPRPPVSATARRASASTSGGGPYRRLFRCPSPPITARPLNVLPSASDGFPWL